MEIKAIINCSNEEPDLILKSEFDLVGFDFEGKLSSIREDSKYNSLMDYREYENEDEAIEEYKKIAGRD